MILYSRAIVRLMGQEHAFEGIIIVHKSTGGILFLRSIDMCNWDNFGWSYGTPFDFAV